MRHVREVLRLQFVGGVLTREIALRIGVAASTVRATLKRFQASALSWPPARVLPRTLHMGTERGVIPCGIGGAAGEATDVRLILLSFPAMPTLARSYVITAPLPQRELGFLMRLRRPAWPCTSSPRRRRRGT